MPRISIIVAHHNDQRLEDTLLSVLENRPRDCEIIVAHDGSYSDPYRLADEVLFVETNAGASRVSKLNEALYATCAPVVHILGEGMLVSEGWCEGAIHQIQRQQVAAVSPLISTRGARPSTYAGLSAITIAKRGLLEVTSQVPAECCGPVLAAGFYSRRMLLGLGGLIESVDSRVVDVDLALSLQSLGLPCAVDPDSVVQGAESLLVAHKDASVTRDLAGLLAAHRVVPGGAASGLKGAAYRLLCSAFNPSQWAPAIAWGVGLAHNRLEAQVQERLNAWTRAQTTQSSAAAAKLNVFQAANDSSSLRKAA